MAINTTSLSTVWLVTIGHQWLISLYNIYKVIA